MSVSVKGVFWRRRKIIGIIASDVRFYNRVPFRFQLSSLVSQRRRPPGLVVFANRNACSAYRSQPGTRMTTFSSESRNGRKQVHSGISNDSLRAQDCYKWVGAWSIGRRDWKTDEVLGNLGKSSSKE